MKRIALLTIWSTLFLLQFEKALGQSRALYESPAGPVPDAYADDPYIDGPYYDQPRRAARPNTVLSGGLELGSGTVGLHLSMLRYFNRFVGWETAGFYRSRNLDWQDSSVELVHYGFDLSFLAQLPNPTILTPFVGAGPGWESWQRSFEGNIYDDNSSLTLVHYIGANLAMSRNFSLSVRHVTRRYVNDVPLRYEDRRQKEDREHAGLQLQFLFGFSI